MAFSSKFVEDMREMSKNQLIDNNKRKAELVEAFQGTAQALIAEWLKTELKRVPADCEKLMLYVTKVEALNNARGTSCLYLLLRLADLGISQFLSEHKIVLAELGSGISYTSGSKPLAGYMCCDGIKISLHEIVSAETCLYEASDHDDDN